MNFYAKLNELEKVLQQNGSVDFTTPYGKVRKIIEIKSGYIVYERDNKKTEQVDIDILYRDYLLLCELGSLTAKNIKSHNKKYKNGKSPCTVTTFMLLMEYLYGCTFIRGRRGRQSEIIW